MKVRKRLLVLLAMAMSLLLATAATSYAQDYDFEVAIDSGTTIGTITLTASDVAYDGQSHLVGVSNTITTSYLINEEDSIPADYNNTNGNREYFPTDKVSIAPAKYYKRDGISWVALGEGEEPTDAGAYKAEVVVHVYRESVTELPEYPYDYYHHAFTKAELTKATATFTINPKTVTVNWSDLEKTYNGSDQFPTAKLSGVISGDDVSVQIVQANGAPYQGNTHKDAGQYKDYAGLTGDNAGNYVLDTDSWTNFTIKPKELTVTWKDSDNSDFDTELTYDGKNHLPKPVVEGAVGNETISAVATNKAGTEYNPTTDNTHIDHGTYTVYAKITAGEGALASNYVIPKSSFTYTINKLKAELAWYRPIYNDTTGEVVGGKQLVKEDTVIGMVYNAKEQKPMVEVTNACTRAGAQEPDVVKIVAVEVEGKHPVEVGNYTLEAKLVSGSGADNYTVDSSKNRVRDFAIIPRPVVLDWGYLPNRDADEDEAIYGEEEEGGFVVDPEDPKYDYMLTYDGKQHSPVVRIMNLAKNDNGDEDDNYVTEITVDSAENFVDDEGIPEDRMFYDAGRYDLIPERLKDQKNYSYFILEQDEETGAIGLSDKNVDKYPTDETPVEFTIKQLPAELNWEPLEFKYYNGQVQNPEGTVVNLQEDEDGNVDECDIEYITYLDDEDDPFPTVDANLLGDDGYEQYTIKATNLVNKNYSLKKKPYEEPEGEDIDTILDYYTIYPLPVEIKWVPDRTEFTYNASMVYHDALIMNIQEPDAEATGRESDDVILVFSDGSVLNEANAGSYTATIVALGGVDPEENQATNYSLLAKPELLDESGPVPNLVRKWKINKKALTVTVDDKAISYGDDPAAVKYTVRYSGLVNGDTNKDDNHNNTNVPGKYTPTGGEEKDVVEGTPTFTRNYNKWGKPGKYTIGVSGLSSDNYSITYKAGTLTVYDKVTALLAKAKAGSKKGTLYWNGVTGAAKYDIYYSHCNTPKKTFTPKYYKTVSGNKTSTKIKKLKKRNFYKFYVVAFDSSGKQIAQSDLSHFCTSNVSGKYTNPKSITPSAKTVNVSKGGTFKLSAKVKKVKKGKKLVNGIHTSKIRYLSETPAVATVTQDGTITGVASGWCRVHVLAANGIWQTVEVYVQ